MGPPPSHPGTYWDLQRARPRHPGEGSEKRGVHFKDMLWLLVRFPGDPPSGVGGMGAALPNPAAAPAA